jgi:hypothetical protein
VRELKKYKLTKTTKKYGSITLYQIEALKDFGDVSKGDKGGFIEKEENLSQEDDAWVSGNARVSGDAEVYGNARVYGELKLIVGYFYHTKEKSEEIEKIEVDEDYELLCSEPKLGEEEDDLDDKTEEAIALLKEKGYRIVKK